MNTLELSEILFAAKDYREFIGKYIQEAKKQGKPMSYRSLAMKAGFASKSYLRDVQVGEKRLTPRSLPKFTKALRFNEDLKKYFTLLTALDEEELNVSALPASEIKKRLERIRLRVRSKGAKADQESTRFYQVQHWLEVYASLGSVELGASLDQIAKRSGLAAAKVMPILKDMAEKSLVRFEETSKLYFATNGHLIFDALGRDAFFKQSYLNSVQCVQKMAEQSFELQDRLFLNSVMSVKTKQLPQFRQELRELLLRFVDTVEDPQGDGLAKLTIAFTPHAP